MIHIGALHTALQKNNRLRLSFYKYGVKLMEHNLPAESLSLLSQGESDSLILDCSIQVYKTQKIAQ